MRDHIYSADEKAELIDVLNDLIEINDDRIECYRKAINDAEPATLDLISIFERMADDSERYKLELLDELVDLNQPRQADSGPGSGWLYQFWTDVKETFGSLSGKSTLECCEMREDAAQRAYKEALESDATIEADVRRLILDQKSALKISHDLIKDYRDNNQHNIKNTNL